MSLVFNIPNGAPGYLPDVPRTIVDKEVYSYLVDLRRETIKMLDGLIDNDLAFADKINGESMLTPEGGLAIRVTNKTGASSVKGEVVTPDSANNNAAIKIVVDVPNPIGVFYEDGVADGEEAWVVVTGIADVYFVGSTTRGQLARGFLTADGGSYVTGQALSEALPTSPFSVDKHFYEIGHVLESRTGAGLAKVVLHFN